MQRWMAGAALGLLLSIGLGVGGAATTAVPPPPDIPKTMAEYAKVSKFTDLGNCTPEPVDGTHYVCSAVAKGEPFPVLCKVSMTQSGLAFCFLPMPYQTGAISGMWQ